MSTPFEISDRSTEKWADLLPIEATLIGISGRDHLPADLSPAMWGAISYEVGEREVLDIRERARARPGFDLRAFHRRMLEAGAIRLDHLRGVMS